MEDDSIRTEDHAPSWDDVRYVIDESLDPSLRHLVEKLLPLATYYMSVEAFVEQYSRYEYGSINHALCAAISSLMKVSLIAYVLKDTCQCAYTPFF